MAGMPGYSQEFAEILASEGADRKRLALREKFRISLEEKLGRTIDDWFAILEKFDPSGSKTQFQLTKHLQLYYGLELWESNVVVYYYLNPDKRFELG